MMDYPLRIIILNSTGRKDKAFELFKEMVNFHERVGLDAEMVKGWALFVDEEFASQVFDPNTRLKYFIPRCTASNTANVILVHH